MGITSCLYDYTVQPCVVVVVVGVKGQGLVSHRQRYHAGPGVGVQCLQCEECKSVALLAISSLLTHCRGFCSGSSVPASVVF